jgi:alkanesulfonate monooxygenase SsuD/methylene tetrahydromethanopterin reductase-like flavin-dependent oxidoreductase (luciferase family)
MKYGINVPIFDEYGDARVLCELARDAESAGWDGFFLWDHLQCFDPPKHIPFTDPWVALSAIALSTERMHIGPMITAIARRRPWKLARETVALDHLSGGRLILGVGLGEPPGADFAAFGEDPTPVVRARKLDEGLDVLAGLWSTQPFSYSGEYFTVRDAVFLPKPLQQPRIPIWVAGTWPHRKPMRRAARWDGVFPFAVGDFVLPTPDELRDIVAYVREHRTSDEPFDVVLAGATPGDDLARAREYLDPYEAAGLTWWHESLNGWRAPFAYTRERIRQGPPRC